MSDVKLINASIKMPEMALKNNILSLFLLNKANNNIIAPNIHEK